MVTYSFRCGTLAVMLALPLWAQTDAHTPSSAELAAVRSTYLLGPDDIISVRVLDAEELGDKGVRIGLDGTINLPMMGRVRASGLTVSELEKQLTAKLKVFIREPEVSVNVVELRSQPVSVIGQVVSPGVHQLQGRKTLVELISIAGGPTKEAANIVLITRQKEWGAIPVPGATPDPSGEFSVAEVNLRDILDAKNPALNIQIMPKDVISIPKAQLIYVLGDVKRAGGFVLDDHGEMSVLQAVSMASGFERTAAQSRSRILRVMDPKDRMKRTEIPVDLKKMLAGKVEDMALRPDDILFVPGSKSKSATMRALEVAVQLGTGVAIYRTQN